MSKRAASTVRSRRRQRRAANPLLYDVAVQVAGQHLYQQYLDHQRAERRRERLKGGGRMPSKRTRQRREGDR